MIVIPAERAAREPESILRSAGVMDSGLAPSARPGMTAEDLRNVSKFIDARLQAVSSRNMYSEHGFDALISPEAGQVCQSFTVVWYCRPGSAEAQAA